MVNEYLTVKEVADRLGMGTPTVYKYVRMGAPVHYWGSVHYRIILSEFIEWMDCYGRALKHKAKTLQNVQPNKPTAESLAERRKQLMETFGI